MNRLRMLAVVTVLCPVLSFTSCVQDEQVGGKQPEAPAITNRLEVPPEVINNLGITFEMATRGRIGVWRTVPGQLEVPESRRWMLRAPARARLLSVVPLWQVVERGSEIARLTSPDLQKAQAAIQYAQRTLERATDDATAARARLEESEASLREVRALETANRALLLELEALVEGRNALSKRQVLEAQRAVVDASKASLDAAIARDELISRVATAQLEADQALLSVGQRLNTLIVLTGLSLEELTEIDAGMPRWQKIESLIVRAPATGVVIALLAAGGEMLEADAPIVQMFDTSELLFRGHLPEGDLGLFVAGARVRLDFPSRRLEPIETQLNPPLPVADAETRMIHVEAVVPNADGVLAHGISVMAQVLVEESKNEEVLLPAGCIVFDGLEAIVFKRDPNDLNIVIRTPVELGARAANRVEVLAGVLDGDLVVADGIHQLKQTGLGKPPQGGHIHADGTWHDDHK